MLGYYLMDPDTDVCQTEQSQISYSIDFMAEQKSIGDPVLHIACCMAYWYWKAYKLQATSIWSGGVTFILPCAMQCGFFDR